MSYPQLARGRKYVLARRAAYLPSLEEITQDPLPAGCFAREVQTTLEKSRDGYPNIA